MNEQELAEFNRIFKRFEESAKKDGLYGDGFQIEEQELALYSASQKYALTVALSFHTEDTHVDMARLEARKNELKKDLLASILSLCGLLPGQDANPD